MQIQVLYFGILRDIFLRDKETITLAPGATVATLLDYYLALAPDKGGLWKALAVAVNQEYARSEQGIAEGDEVALLPPVSGGSPSSAEGELAVHVELVRTPIEAHAILSRIKQGEDGAVVVFDGIVRNHSRGRRTLYLVYEAYEEMALSKMKDLALDAIVDHGVREVALVHRLGHLDIGETSIFIAVASAHRAQAFEACRWLIDTLKSTVPIWKKEYFEDGAVWVNGDPFPVSIVPIKQIAAEME